MKHLFFVIITCLSILGFSQKKMAKGNDFFDQGEFDKALTIYQKILKKDSTNTVAWYNTGLCYLRKKNTEMAIPAFKNAIRIDAEYYLAYQRLGEIYSYNKDYYQGAYYLRKAEDLGARTDSKFYFELGSNYYFMGKNGPAIKYLEKAYELDSTYSGTLNNLGWSYLDINPKKSCYFFHQAYSLDSTDAVNINNLGYAYLMSNNLDSAKICFDKSLELNPENSFVYRNYGLYYKSMGDKELACANLNKAIELEILTQWGEYYIKDLLEYCKEEEE